MSATSDPLAAARTLFTEGVALYEAGRHADAADHFERALALAPGRVSVQINLGAAWLQLGRPAEAIAVLDAALAAEPQHADAWCHRGQAAGELDRHDDALHSFERALALEPGHVLATFWRAVALVRLRHFAQALQALGALLERQPGHAPAWMLHGQALQSLGRHDEALPSYQRAVELAPDLGQAWSLLAQLLADTGRSDDAAAAFERAIEAGADAQTNRYLLAALGRGAAPPAAPPAYVRALFGGYAGDFETHLLDVLRYRAHEEVVQAARRVLSGRVQAGDGGRAVRRALDLGCGTGLCGPLLRPLTEQLDGVDLSSTMLEAARRRGVYDALIEAELVEHLQATPQRYGLVVCADTFIYLGDLSAAFGGVRRVLEPGGCFAFSVERADDSQDFALTANRRYAHSEHHVRKLAAAHGFELASLHRAALREEQRQAVEGLIVCAVVPGG